MRYFFLFLSIIMLESCDILGYIEVQNYTDSNVNYYCYWSYPKGFKDTLHIHVSPIKGENTNGKAYGFAQRWHDQDIRKYLWSVTKIQIETCRDTMVITDTAKMVEFFKAHRRGLYNEKIVIKLE